MKASSLVLPAIVLVSSVLAFAATERYVAATVTNDRLDIRTDTGRSILPNRLDPTQAGFEQVAIAQDRTTVGWLATYPNAGTSYPIALALVLYSNGRTRVFRGRELPISR